MGLGKPLDIVAIDGPAGSGKSTVALAVAKRIGFTFLDTGAMYRAVALGAIEHNIQHSDQSALQAYLKTLSLEIDSDADIMRLFIDGRDVTEAIRRPEMGQHASDFSRLSIVREFCTALQRRVGSTGRIVCEGRDMGTVVFPEARWKYFMTASLDERSFRRWRELSEKGEKVELIEIRKSLEKRDYQDTNRDIAPLKPAIDAMILDTTQLTISQVILCIVRDVMGPEDKKGVSLLHNC